jgi:hypothetical protein
MKNSLLISLLFLSFSCSKKDNPDMAMADLPGPIQTLITEAEQECPACGITIVRYQYNKGIIYGSVCGGVSRSQGLWCDCIMVYYDRKGELIKYKEDLYKDINRQKKLIGEIYRCRE